MMRQRMHRGIVWSAALGVAALSFGVARPAAAHVDLVGPAFAGTSQVLTFAVGHGCATDDTVGIEIHIPEAVTSVRALPGAWGEAQITTAPTGLVSAVSWSKPVQREADDHYYEFQLRIRVPSAPFTRLFFPTTQTCRSSDGQETTVDWAELPDGGAVGDEPAPSVWIVPPRHPGWNRYEVGQALSDLSIFDDAQIVWSGTAAYSSNPAIAEMIRNDAAATELSSIPSGATIWVKY